MKPKEVLRAEAEVRNAAWRALDPSAQLSSLDARAEPATAQRARIMKRVAYLPAPAQAGGVLHDNPLSTGAVVLTVEDREPRARHKKGQRGDGRKSKGRAS